MTPGQPGIIAALRPELQTLETGAAPPGLLRAQSGTGPERAEQAGEKLLAMGANALVSWGCAGALHPGRGPGDLMMPERIITPDGDALPVDADWRRAVAQHLPSPFFGGALVESDAPVTEVDAKHRLHLDSGAWAVDMESAGLARVARRHGVPFLAIRAIADRADQALPRHSAGLIKPDGSLRAAGIARALAAGPDEWRRLKQAGEGFRSALATLRRILAADIFTA